MWGLKKEKPKAKRKTILRCIKKKRKRKRKPLTNITDEHRCKNPQQNTSKQNQTTQ